MQRKIVALILAAGYSSRMGEFKPLMTIDDKPVIAWAVDSFREAGITDIRVVVGYQADKLLPILYNLKVTPVMNYNFPAGMFSSVQAGLRTFAAEAEAFFLLPGDMPMIEKSALDKIRAVFCRNEYQVVIPSFQSRRGHPPLIGKGCFDRILGCDVSANLRSVLQEFADQTCVVETADQGILLDMDTPEDYRTLLKYSLYNKIPAPY